MLQYLEKNFSLRHTKQNGEWANDAITQLAKRAVELEEQVNEGAINTEGAHDILTQALGIDKQRGRVRGKQSYVTPSVYFNTLVNMRKSIVVNEELERMREKQESMEQALANLTSQMMEI
ncbi:hypothetical protein FNV43_RR08231 [Rhamnella rubrinervis]|uniref:Uncharacterized protein n=1 Tax=Rhamnella rubrinervis TaxID=2594499 RepID=A0A8K0MN71_9ROSA|nr:hypothetical protein FNV43_RR08231 [Rhamnella rubrinervis]